MLKKLLLLAVVPLLVFSQPAEARRMFWWESAPDGPPPSVYEGPPPDYYADQPDPYAAPDDQFNQDQYLQYRRDMDRRYPRRPSYSDQLPPNSYDRPAFGPDRPYAAPIHPVKPATKVVKKLVPRLPLPAVIVANPPVMPAGPLSATASPAIVKAPPVMPTGSILASPSAAPAALPNPPAPALPSTTASTTTAAAPVKVVKGGAVNCDKGAGIVSSFGFTNVTTKSCTGASLLYNAERSGKPFEIEVSTKSGELLAVKKL